LNGLPICPLVTVGHCGTGNPVTFSWHVADAVPPTASVAVTVYENTPTAVGDPENTPLELMDRPLRFPVTVYVNGGVPSVADTFKFDTGTPTGNTVRLGHANAGALFTINAQLTVAV